MINWQIELIYVLAQILFFGRMIYQANASRKAGQSITPIWYWIITLFASWLLGVYGFFLGSITMPLMTIFSTVYYVYNIVIEWNRIEGGGKLW